ncbi:hypothetical protein DFJ43DRAFT_1149752 [Lentinula guzmanii]|uniref:Uncharacterized protein n=1 Tax=Lentinula guzmanii TaxID=2804957 RepID=A0AA38K0R9_9AGAR|nr:hypothetical protein DFJ43DRAFT_1149752 [Lentinula guzmanii]
MAPKKQPSTARESSASESTTTSTTSSAQPSRQPQTNPSAPDNLAKPQKFQPKANHNTPCLSNKPSDLTPNGDGTDPEPVSTHSTPVSAKDRPLTEVISEKFAPFDHNRLVVGPFTEETSRDANFEQDTELGTLLLDAILETHAWAAARPKFESHLTVQRLENKISDVMEVESTQGMSQSSSNALHSLSSWPALLFGRAFAPDVLFPIITLYSAYHLIERTRQDLNEFVIRMKSALAALTGF